MADEPLTGEAWRRELARVKAAEAAKKRNRRGRRRSPWSAAQPVTYRPAPDREEDGYG